MASGAKKVKGAKGRSRTNKAKGTLTDLNEPWLRFTVAQRKLIIDKTMVPDSIIKKLKPVRVKGRLQPVSLTNDEWDDLASYVHAGAEDNESAEVRKKLSRIGKRIDRNIFGEWGDEDRYYLKDEDDW